MTTKRCFKCEIVKDIDDFYVHHQMADGHLNKCKECTCRDVAENYRARRGQYSAYEHARFKEPARKAKLLAYQRIARVRHPQRYAARWAISNAIRDGKIVRQPCDVCGNPDSQAHHDDYSRPLEVRWLCFRHHRELHGQVVLAGSSPMGCTS